MTAAAAIKQSTLRIERADPSDPILYASGPTEIGIRAGTVINDGEHRKVFVENDTILAHDTFEPGKDYGVRIDSDGKIQTVDVSTENPLVAGCFAGFHFAPAGYEPRPGGGRDTVPAINPHSLWDLDFRFAGPDPRGMALVRGPGVRLWVDIYLLGVDHDRHGTSRCGVTIADGRDLPNRPDGKGRYKKLDYPTAVEIYQHHGKRLLGAEEFFAAAYGVQERCSRDDEPELTGALHDQAERFISRHGLFDVTGTMWQWGTDGHPDDPRPSLFGGSWLIGGNAGSRYADLVYWPGDSNESLSVRGGGDHLSPA